MNRKCLRRFVRVAIDIVLVLILKIVIPTTVIIREKCIIVTPIVSEIVWVTSANRDF